ncbi:TetR/AcrR family transcriptional regulator [Amycolatopsis sp. WQ 127309]|uniref:TetR/AcrR family transcriptional regulator n=1 Tax=Amycolatopsis sp. WQ 127309 TaxID=2932773 RepID=UPI001FF1494D|nr:TetR/AcrR family transcriptional regulator [Amycolatopsis sp. WQ 127309]UOZ03969.1 TetR/AcrR family transcriptional regulator [Amycolatopsis sp. WQ 127309]
MPENATKPEARGQARREQVLTAAAVLFGERGFHGSSMGELARRAGMSVGHIYHYFENKDAIIEALVDREMAQRPGALAGLSQPAGDEQSVVAQLENEVRRVLERERLALWLEILAEAARNPQIAAKLHAADDVASERLTAAVSARLPGLSRRAAAERAGAVAALFQGLIVRSVYQPGLDRAAVVRATRDALRKLLETPTPEGGK